MPGCLAIGAIFMPDQKPVFRQTPRATLSAGVSAAFAEKITLTAASLGITRNRLMIMAIDAGLDTAIAQARAAAAAQRQTQR